MIRLSVDQLIEKLRQSGINVIEDSDTHRFVVSAMANNLVAEIDARFYQDALNAICPDGYRNEIEESVVDDKSS